MDWVYIDIIRMLKGSIDLGYIGIVPMVKTSGASIVMATLTVKVDYMPVFGHDWSNDDCCGYKTGLVVDLGSNMEY